MGIRSFDAPPLALIALLLPPPASLLPWLVATVARAPATLCLALLLLALAGALPHRATPGTGDATHPTHPTHTTHTTHTTNASDTADTADELVSQPAVAVRLRGTWRHPPGAAPLLVTPRGEVLVLLADDLEAPTPGTPVDVLARVDAEGRARAVAVTIRGAPRGAWLDRWAATAARRARDLVHPERRGLVAALVLGDRSDLGHAVRRACQSTGVMHLLALSGLHVALVATGLTRLLGGSASQRWEGLGAALLAFVLVAGARPPLVRALLGWVLLTVGRRTARALSPLRRLLSVTLVVLAASPALRDDLGTRLSFLGVAGLLAMLRLPLGRLTPWLAPAGAFLVTAPLCAEAFGVVQPWGVVFTPVLAPVVALILLVGLVAILPGEAFAALDPLLGPLLDGAGAVLLALIEWGELLLPAPLRPPALPLPGMGASLLVFLALLGLGRPGHTTRGRAEVP